jgi:hypothetical protein
MEQAPTTAPSPTLTPGEIKAHAATHALGPIVIGFEQIGKSALV